ncbi:hypothetical protein [uncultured Methanobrevibacter sp.]|uniref:hypothetical protein n=1 Tax=uncultured Methanobrevibacter sp. TaxID=253161 RepID=UPI0025EB23D8|nr:hypothetical protein [uncultured Methanobrevibacter sp.]
MTKRFTYVKNNSITQYQSLPIQEIGKGKALHCQGIVDKLNKLSDENEQLNLISNYRGEMVSFATSLIQDMGSEEMLKMWNDFTEVMYQKWKKKRGIK